MTIMMLSDVNNTPDLDILRRRIRIITLLAAAEQAGLAPMPISKFHTFAYLSNVLSPVWEMLPLDGKVLKRGLGPFYPILQRDLDRLVGIGIVLISHVAHVFGEDRHWRLEGSYQLNRTFSDRIIRR